MNPLINGDIYCQIEEFYFNLATYEANLQNIFLLLLVSGDYRGIEMCWLKINK